MQATLLAVFLVGPHYHTYGPRFAADWWPNAVASTFNYRVTRWHRFYTSISLSAVDLLNCVVCLVFYAQVLPRVHLFPLWGTRARESVVIFHMCRRRRHDYRTLDSPDALLWCAPCNDGDSANGQCSCDVVRRRREEIPRDPNRQNGQTVCWWWCW